jgi:hypothetical protein
MGDSAIGDLDRRGSLWRTERRRTERWPALAVACAGGGDPRASARNVRPFILFDARVAEIGAELFPGRGDRRRSDRNVRQRERRLIGTRSARHWARDQHQHENPGRSVGVAHRKTSPSRGAFSFARAAMIDQNRQFGPAPANRLSCALRRPSSSSLIPKGRHSHSLRGVKPTRQPPQPEATGAGWRRRNV